MAASMSELSVSVVIPAFNEAGAVGPLVEEIRSLLARELKSFEVVVVDDGSTDGTGEEAGKAQARVVRHPVNRGYGHALRTGIAAAKNDWIVTIDADRSYPPAQIAVLLPFAPAFDLVIGARTGVHFWGSPFSAFLRWTYLRIASFIVGEKVPDANSGLRLLRRSLALEPGPVQCLGYSYSTTMTLSFLQDGRFVKYVPIEFQARAGKSKVRMVRDVLRTLQLMTQVMIVYNPLKLFVALAAFPALAAVGLLAYGACPLHHGRGYFLVSGVLMILLSKALFIAGCLLDSLRMLLRRGPKA